MISEKKLISFVLGLTLLSLSVLLIPKYIKAAFNLTNPIEIIDNIGNLRLQPNFNNPQGVAVDSVGNIYVADTDNDKIRKYDVGTSVWIAFGSSGSEAGQFNAPLGVTVDGSGNIYVADTDNHRIQKYNVGTTTWTTFGSSGSGLGQFNKPKGVAVDSYENIYVADTDNHRIQKYDAGATVWTSLGSAGSGLGQFYWPFGLTVDSTGNIYVTDPTNQRIQKYEVGTTTWTVYGSSGNGPGQFNYANGVTVDSSGNIYVADTDNHRIQKYNVGTTTWTAYGSYGSELGRFNKPHGVAVDSSGNIYVADSSNNRIQKYNVGTTTWTGYLSSGSGLGEFIIPYGVAVDTSDNIYVADTYNHRIQKYNIGTTTWTVYGSGGTGLGEFTAPHGVAVDSSGNIYVADTDNNRIQKYDIGTTTWTAYGDSEGWGGDGLGEFYSPNGVAVDSVGNIYVADTDNNRIQKYDIGTTTWTAYGDSEGWGGDGLGEFYSPNGVAVDSVGNIYVADTDNNRIQKYDVGATNWKAYTWTAYGNIGGWSGNGLGEFTAPRGVAIDREDNVYVADFANDRIQKYDVNTYTWTAYESGSGEEDGLDTPSSIAVDSLGNVYVADFANHRIQKLTYELVAPSPHVVDFVDPIEIIDSVNNLSFQSSFNSPSGMEDDNDGNIYVADTGNNRIQKYNVGTTTWTVYGSGGTGLGEFNSPNGVEVDSVGNIYIADTNNNRIQKYNIGTTTWTVYGSGGTGLGEFNSPNGVEVDSVGNIYIADTNNYRVQKYNIGTTTWTDLGEVGYVYDVVVDTSDNLYALISYEIKKYNTETATWVTVSGSGGSGLGEFNDARGIAIDSIGNIYVSDTYNYRIQKYDVGTTTWKTFGSEGNGLGKFEEPGDIAVDNGGNIYVADTENNRIQKLVYFTPYTINYSTLGHGSLVGNTFQNLTTGQTGTAVTAVGDSGYTFIAWSDGSIDNPRVDIGGTGSVSVSAGFNHTRTIFDVDSEDMLAEINRNFITLGSESPTDTSLFTFNLNYNFVADSVSVRFPIQTVATPVGTDSIDLTQFITINNTLETKAKLDRAITSLQFGIPNTNLSFSSPVTVSMIVGSSYNGQTLQIKYQKEGETSWNDETTCLVAGDNCVFQTNHATTFAVLKNVAQQSNNSNNNTSSPSSSNLPDHSCHSSKPVSISDLFQIDTSSTSAKIFFTPQSDTNDYFISFSSKNKNAEEHGEQVSLLREGVQSHTIYHLKPNTTYYVKVRGQNGCMPGDWSTILKFTTAKSKTSWFTKFYKYLKGMKLSKWVIR